MTKKSKKKRSNNKKDNNNNDIILTKSFGGSINDKIKGPIPSIFQKESDEIVEKRKFMGSNPIDMEKRKLIIA